MLEEPIDDAKPSAPPLIEKVKNNLSLLDPETSNNDNTQLLRYFVDDEIKYQRCQYQLKPLEGDKNLLKFMQQDKNMTEYFNDSTNIKKTYLYCNLLKYIFVIYYKHNTKLLELTDNLREHPVIKSLF